MRPIIITANAVGPTQWVPVNYLEVAFGVGLGFIPWSTATGLSATVQHTFDDLQAFRQVSLSRSTTTATVTDLGPYGLGHGLTTNDSVIIRGAGAPFDTPKAPIGQGDVGATVTVTSATQYTYTVANSGPTAGTGMAVGLRVFPHTSIVTASARVDGSYFEPIRAVRLNVVAISAGAVDLLILQGMGH